MTNLTDLKMPAISQPKICKPQGVLISHCLFTVRQEFIPQTNRQVISICRWSPDFFLQVLYIGWLSDFKNNIYFWPFKKKTISLVLIKEGYGENLGLIWNTNSLSDWVRTFFYFLFFIIASVLKIFVSIDQFFKHFPSCWLRKEINGGNIGLFWKYYGRSVTSNEAPHTGTSMFLYRIISE